MSKDYGIKFNVPSAVNLVKLNADGLLTTRLSRRLVANFFNPEIGTIVHQPTAW